MKLLQVGYSHPRNSEFMIRACKLFSIEYYYNATPENDYDIIWCPTHWIDPELFPLSKFIFGPQFWVFPNANDPIFTLAKPEHKNRCIYTCLSDWIVAVYNEFHDISLSPIPFIPLPFGLNVEKHIKDDYEYDCIIYFKHRHPSLLEFSKSVLDTLMLKYKVFIYGNYNLNEYITTLKKTKFAVWIGSHESQGFAVQECLATGTPIFVYDVVSMKDEHTDHYNYINYKEKLLATTVPYWNTDCGMKVYSHQEFIDRLPEFINNLEMYNPSDFINKNLTDKICFDRFLAALSIKT
jgi:hypothetical protein